MATYRIEWKKSAVKDLRCIDKKYIPKILNKIDSLQKDPYSGDVRKLIGSELTYRLRVGKYRVIYEVVKESIRITIIHIRHRKDAYR